MNGVINTGVDVEALHLMKDCDEGYVRKVNLVEVLFEETGNEVTELTPEEIAAWTEEEIRLYFASGGVQRPGRAQREVPTESAFLKWFPGVGRVKTQSAVSSLLLCFHNAGNAEDMYTSEGTAARKAVSPLLEWCRDENVECLAPQLPGRGMRREETRIETARDAAAEILNMCRHRLEALPYVVVGHSMGTWIAYEFLIRARNEGIRMPSMVFLSGMPSPDLPFEERPWRQQHLLNDAEFKEECRAWDINDVIFSEGMWKTYEPLLRSDFTIFDSYTWQHEDEPPFSFPIHSFWGLHDRRVTESMVRGWSQFTTGGFRCQPIKGNHLWPLEKEAKEVWLKKIVQELLQTL